MKTKKTAKQKTIFAVSIVLIIASVITGTIMFLLNTRFFKEDDPEGSNNGKLDSDIVTPADIKEKNVNILLVGIDEDQNRNEQNYAKLTDTIMVISYDMQNQKANVLQIPRDSFVGDIVSSGKLNAVYSKTGGVAGLARQISSMFQITIDHYITINMDAFVSIVDEIGGVEVDVPQDIFIDDIHIKKGKQTLSGLQAQGFVRNRDYAMADIKRMEMQKLFMQSLLNKVMNLKYSEIIKLAPTIFKQLSTDLNLSEALGYYKKSTSLDVTNLNFFSAPFLAPPSGKQYRYGSNDVLSLDKQEIADMLNENFRTYTDQVQAEQLKIKQAPLVNK